MRISDWSSDVCSSDLTSDDQPSTRIACVLSRADRHDTPDNIADIVGDQQGAGLVDHHADRTPEGMPVLTDESGQYILRCTDRQSDGSGKSVYVRVDIGGSRIIKQKK